MSENKWLGDNLLQRWEWFPIYNVRQIKDKVLLTNRIGDWDVLSQQEYNALNKALVSRDLIQRLADLKLVLYGDNQTSILPAWKSFNNSIDQNGPRLHIIHLTQRCNLGCSYCHSAAIPLDKKGRDLSSVNALNIVSFILKSPSKFISVNFQGGEPTLMPHLIDEIMTGLLSDKNKIITASITTNGTNLTEDVIEVLSKYNIGISVSLDGPEEIHDSLRINRDGSGSWQQVMNGRKLLQEHPNLNLSGSILVLSKDTIHRVTEVIDEYVKNKQQFIHLKPITKLGFGKSNWNDLGVDFETYWENYIKAISYMLDLQQQGVYIIEIQIKFALQMLIERTKPAYVDFRNPCGLVYGVLNYDIDGKIYGCHEGKRKKEFLLGDATSEPIELLTSETANSLAGTSVLDQNVECRSCTYLAYCSPCPAHTLQMTGTTKIKPYEDFHCKFTLRLFDWLIDQLENSPNQLMGWWRYEMLKKILR
jgi:uncharacterized protein